MYRLTIDDAKSFRSMERGDLYNLVHRCNHRFFDKISVKNDDDYFVCKKCKISWFIYQKLPKRGNPKLEKYLFVCKHEHICTHDESTNYNKCLECGIVFEKTEIAKLWKNVRSFSEKITATIQKTQKKHTNEEKIQSGRPIKFVWDPDMYGDDKWGVEYTD
jgi:hemerythrin superfamily protein